MLFPPEYKMLFANKDIKLNLTDVKDGNPSLKIVNVLNQRTDRTKDK